MDESATSPDDVNKMLLSVCLLITTLFAMAIGALLIWFAVLREDQMFWTNAGDYPIWLRDLVHFTYLPCLAATLLLLMALSMVWCARICGSIRFFIIESMLLLTCWILVSISGFIAFNNNVTNLIEGRKLHQKAPREPRN